MIRRRVRRVAVALIGVLLVALGLPLVAVPAGAATVPSLSVGDLTTVEGDLGIANLKVSVDLSAPTSARVKVPVSIVASADGATSGADAQIRNGTVTFASGVTTKVVAVNSIGDTVIEPDQHVLVVLGTPVGGTATIADGIGVVTLVDDDANGVSPTIEVSIGDAVVGEADAGLHRGYIPITLSKPATVTTKVVFAIDCSTNDLLDDISIKKSGTITFSPGQRAKSITFTIPADLEPEIIAEAVQRITPKAGSVKVLDARGDATVNDDDGGSFPTFTGHPVPGFTATSLPTGSFAGPSIGTIEQLTVTPSGAPSSPGWAASIPPSKITYANSPSTSYDGRYVAFISEQPDLVAGDTNGIRDVFVRDRATGTTERVSLRTDGGQVTASDLPGGLSDPYMLEVRISADGRYVAFDTWASLDPSDPRTGSDGTIWPDVYVFDRVSHTTRAVSKTTGGSWLHGQNPEISADGRYVLFESSTPTYNKYLFVRDLQSNTTTLVFDHGIGNRVVSNSALSADGRYAAVIAEGNLCFDQQLLVIDLADGSTERVDVTDDGDGAAQEDAYAGLLYTPTISADGRYVAFKSHSWNLIPGKGYPGSFNGPGPFDASLVHVYVRDRVDRTTTMVGVGPGGQLPAPTPYFEELGMSADGQKLAVSNMLEGQGTVFDLAAGTSSPLGFPYSESRINTRSWPTSMSGDGRTVAFASENRINSGLIIGDAWAQRIP